jgi:exosortase/archaeosortase family protein
VITYLKTHPILIYLIKFAGIFCICYFGTLAIIGLSAPAGHYSYFIDTYLDYISGLRKSLMFASRILLSLVGYNAVTSNIYSLKIEYGKAIHIGFDCLGYGVMSFWIAFIAANKGSLIKKIKWIFGGLLLIWLINVTRISLLLIATNKHTIFPLGLNHHTWFNVVAYLLIFILIWLYDRSGKRSAALNKSAPALNVTDQ